MNERSNGGRHRAGPSKTLHPRWFVLRGVKPQRRLKVSLRFVGRSWYLSVYYAISWAVLPLAALMLESVYRDNALRILGSALG